MRPVPDHDVIFRHLGRQAGEVGNLELAVAVAQHDPRLVAGANPRDYRGAIAAIDQDDEPP